MRRLTYRLLPLLTLTLLLTSCNPQDALPIPPPATPIVLATTTLAADQPAATTTSDDAALPVGTTETNEAPLPPTTPAPLATRSALLSGRSPGVGAGLPQPSLDGQIRRGPRGKHEVAITFDAGGGSGDVPAILQALRQRGLHITFFLTGRWVAANHAAAQAIAAAGQDIANHTYNHLHLTRGLSDALVISEISSAEQEIRSITGVDPHPYFRFPYGEYNAHTLQLVHNLGYTSVLWTLDSLDSVGKPKSAQFLVERVTHSNINLDGAIILMHIGGSTSAQALPTILDRLATEGYHVVTIAELLR